MAVITLPWPDRKLHPNARPHWRAKAAATKLARAHAHWLAVAFGLPKISAAHLKLTMSFAPPDRRRHDLDSLAHSMKPSIDGICDAIGVDDRAFSIVDMRKLPPEKPGKVIIEISEVEA